MKKKVWILVSIAIIGIVVLFYTLLKPDQLNREYSSVVYSNDTGFTTPITIKLKGEIYKGLLGANKFIGEMTADNELKYKITLTENEQQYWGLITTFGENRSIRTIGIVMVSRKIDKVWIKLEDINQRYQLQDGYISGPANNLKEAQQIALEVMSGNGK